VSESGDHNVVVTFDTGPNVGAFVGLSYAVRCYVQNRDPAAGPVTDDCGSVVDSSLEANGTASGTLPGVYSQIVANVTGLDAGTQFDCLVEASLAQPPITKCQFAGNISTSVNIGDWRLGGAGEDCDTVCAEADGELACNVNGMRNVTSSEKALYVAGILGLSTEDLTPYPSLPFTFSDAPGYVPDSGQYKVCMERLVRPSLCFISMYHLSHAHVPLRQGDASSSTCEAFYDGFVRFCCCGPSCPVGPA